MKNQAILYGVMGLGIGILLTVLVTANAINNNNYSMMQMMGIRQGATTSSMANNIDKHFIEQMIPHHEGAIEMAKLAKDRSKRPEILSLSDAIIQSQAQEITLMQSWYRNWYGTDVPINSNSAMGMGRGIMHGGMMGGNTTDIESLQNAIDFDKAFLQEMIPHHQMAVMMAQMLLSGTGRPEMKKLGQDIILAQEKEIKQMQTWLTN